MTTMTTQTKTDAEMADLLYRTDSGAHLAYELDGYAISGEGERWVWDRVNGLWVKTSEAR